MDEKNVETQVEQTTQAAGTGAQPEPTPETEGSKKVKKPMTPEKKKKLIVALVAALVVFGALGVAGWKWHEMPSFCNAICHSPMDRYVEGYYSGDDTLLITKHAGAGIECLECHHPGIETQIMEVTHWVSGNFYDPLYKRNLGNDFCLDPNCHPFTYQDLEQATADLPFNPHSLQHGEQQCASCHRMHDQSVLYCTQCHNEAAQLIDSNSTTKGWLTVDQAKEQGLHVIGL